MADDDGFILNFTTRTIGSSNTGGIDSLVSTSNKTDKKKKGGRWKDVLREKQKLQYQKKQIKTRKNPTSNARKNTHIRLDGNDDAGNITAESDEVQRIMDEIKSSRSGKSKAKSKPPTKTTTNDTPASGKQVISSLFTSNPEIPELPPTEKEANQGESTLISNAVVDTSSFTGIGLDKKLTEHLGSKLEISKPTAIQQNAIPTLLGRSTTNNSAEAADKDDDNEDFDVEGTVKNNKEHDVFIQAATGSGKTLAYLLPIFQRLQRASASATSGPAPSREMGAFAIILTPTRELAQQVLMTAQTLVQAVTAAGGGHWIVPGIVIGGDKRQSEKSRLRKGVTVLACTPGRLLDHLENTKSFIVDHLRWLVLDEADRLLELGFEETLTKILALLDEHARRRVRTMGHKSVATSLELPRRRINVLCSATLRDNVRKLADHALVDPLFVTAGSIHDTALQAAAATASKTDGELKDQEDQDGGYTAPSQLVQKAVVVPAKLRLVTLVAQLRNTFRAQPTSKVLVFVSCQDSVDFVYFLLGYGCMNPDDNENEKNQPKLSDETVSLDATVVKGSRVYRLHGSMAQKRRTETVAAFIKSRQAGVLVTTDVAARGLDLPQVTSIVQFDPPADIASYVHRIGRTARLGKAGEAVLFLLPSESEYVALLRERGLHPDDEKMETILQGMAGRDEWQPRATELQTTLEKFVAANKSGIGLAQQAFLSSIRAYATHVASERHIFHVRLLHFGHMAKAFALRETPHQVASGKGNNTKADKTKLKNKEKREKEAAAKRKPIYKRTNDISEFAVGDIAAYYGPRVKRGKVDNDDLDE